MATSRKRVRLSIGIHFISQEQKKSFSNRMSEVKKLLTPPGSRPIDNYSLFVTLFDLVSEHESPSTSTPSPHTTPPLTTPRLTTPPLTTQSFLSNSGKHFVCSVDIEKKLYTQACTSIALPLIMGNCSNY